MFQDVSLYKGIQAVKPLCILSFRIGFKRSNDRITLLKLADCVENKRGLLICYDFQNTYNDVPFITMYHCFGFNF